MSKGRARPREPTVRPLRCMQCPLSCRTPRPAIAGRATRQSLGTAHEEGNREKKTSQRESTNAAWVLPFRLPRYAAMQDPMANAVPKHAPTESTTKWVGFARCPLGASEDTPPGLLQGARPPQGRCPLDCACRSPLYGLSPINTPSRSPIACTVGGSTDHNPAAVSTQAPCVAGSGAADFVAAQDAASAWQGHAGGGRDIEPSGESQGDR